MPQSMTGIGFGRASNEQWSATVELRSVNHRHLDLRFRLGPHGHALQPLLTKTIKAAIVRGHIDAHVAIARQAGRPPRVELDLELASSLGEALRAVGAAIGDERPPSAVDVAAMPGVLELEQPDDHSDAVADVVTEAAAQAVAELLVARRAEGAHLASDLSDRLTGLRQLHGELAELAIELVPARRAQLQERLGEAMAALRLPVDEGRLEHELVMFADRTDLNEELVRLEGHLAAFGRTLESDQPGRKLGFLTQELLREINTIGSKSNSLQITEKVIAAKIEVERLREQVLNLA